LIRIPSRGSIVGALDGATDGTGVMVGSKVTLAASEGKSVVTSVGKSKVCMVGFDAAVVGLKLLGRLDVVGVGEVVMAVGDGVGNSVGKAVGTLLLGSRMQ